MSVLIFRLNNVDIDEAEEVRELFSAHRLDFYETSAGRWGMSVAGIWLKDDSQLQQAKGLLAEYGQQRLLRVRAQRRQEGQQGAQQNLRAPLQYMLVALSLAIILFLSLWPFLSMGGS